jgi:hypothetical protein
MLLFLSLTSIEWTRGMGTLNEVTLVLWLLCLNRKVLSCSLCENWDLVRLLRWRATVMFQLYVLIKYILQSQPGKGYVIPGLCCCWHKCRHKAPKCCEQEQECGTASCLDQHVVRVQGCHAVDYRHTCLTHEFYSSVPTTRHRDISVMIKVNGPVTMYIHYVTASSLKSWGAQAGQKIPFFNINWRSISMFLNMQY